MLYYICKRINLTFDVTSRLPLRLNQSRDKIPAAPRNAPPAAAWVGLSVGLEKSQKIPETELDVAMINTAVTKNFFMIRFS